MKYIHIKTTITLLLVLLVTFTIFEVCAFSLSENVRIGLIYSKKPAALFTIEGNKGLNISQNQKNIISKVVPTVISSPLIVMKDVYYDIDNNNIRIIDNGQAQINNWHILVENEVPTYDDAVFRTVYYKSKGLDVFPVFNGKWQTITGCFDSFEAANYNKSSLLKSLPGVSFTIMEPKGNRFLILKDKKIPFFLYESDTYELTIEPNTGGYLKLGGDPKKNYRGSIAVFKSKAGDLTAVNIINIEQYLYGVVPFEIGGASPIESIKAQAVAARNYAINSTGKHESEKFDLCDTVDCQVYGGVSGETANSNLGVDETKGKLLMYEGKPAWLFYFSSTGGLPTEDVENVWGSKVPYLKSVENKYESGGTYHFTWNYDFTLDKIKSILTARQINIGDITNVQIVNRSQVGRVTEVKIIGTKGEKSFKKESARTIFKLDSQYYNVFSDADMVLKSNVSNINSILAGKNILSSQGKSIIGSTIKTAVIKGVEKTATVNTIPQKFRFDGKGWGHSVGLSQDGAIGMAKAGFTYDKILTHFFPGTVIN